MALVFNGETLPFRDGETVTGLLRRLDLPGHGIAVERNLEIVPRSSWPSTRLENGDRVEIVQFVGGG